MEKNQINPEQDIDNRKKLAKKNNADCSPVYVGVPISVIS